MVPEVLGYPERRRPPSIKKICLDRVHTSLKRQCMLQRMRTEGHAGLLVDTREQVLDSLFRRGAGKRPPSHMRQHLRAAIIQQPLFVECIINWVRFSYGFHQTIFRRFQCLIV